MTLFTQSTRPAVQPSALRRRTFLGGSLAGAGVLGAGLSFGSSNLARAATGEQYLGTPITGVTAAGLGFTSDSSGRVISVMIAGGEPSIFSAVDAVTGELLTSQTLTAVKQAWTYKTAPDRSVYIGTQSWGKALRFDPDSKELTEVGARPFGQTHFWALAITDAGQVFAGTYPDGKVLQYDPRSGTWSDHGQVVAGANYVRSLATDGSMVYAGTGTVARIIRLDPATGTTTEIPLPDDMRDQTFVYDLDVAGDRLFARMTTSKTMLVYDLVREQWIDRVEDCVGLHVSGEGQLINRDGEPRRVALYTPGDGPIMAYDLATGDRLPTTLEGGGWGNRDWSWQRLDLDGFPKETVLTGTSVGTVKAYNPTTHKTYSIATQVKGTPHILRSLGTGPAGEIYAGGYLSPRGIGLVDPDTGETTQLPWSAQVEGMTTHGTDLMLGVYPDARIFRYDTTQPWSASSNPGTAISLGEHQDRPVALTPAGHLTAVGTVPDYGQLGGALSLVDRATGSVEVHRHVVPDQAVVTLLHRDGIIYGGSAIWGGLGIEPTATEAELVAFDLATRTVLFSVVPVPGETSVGGLAFDDSGALWGVATNTLFRFDPETRQVTHRRTYFDFPVDAEYFTGHGLFWHDGHLVGNTANTVFTVDTSTLDLTTIATNKTNLAIDRLGNYYYSKGGDHYRWVP